MKQNYKWLYETLTPFRKKVLLGVVLVALTVLANAGLLGTSAVLLSKAALQPPILLLMTLIVGVRFFGISRAVVRYFERLVNHSIAFRILGKLRSDIYSAIEPKVPNHLPQYGSGNIYVRLVKNIDKLQYFYIKGISIPLGSLLVTITLTLVLLYFIGPMAFLYFFIMIVFLIILPYRQEIKFQQLRQAEEVAFKKLAETMYDYLEGSLDLQANPRRQKMQREQISQDLNALRKIQHQLFTKERLQSILITFISQLVYIAMLFFAAYKVIIGELPGYFLAMVALITLAGFETAQNIPNAMSEIQASKAAADQIAPLIENKAEYVERTHWEPNGYDIELIDVDFHYHLPEMQWLENISLSIPEGSRVYFVGESGSGKTSLAKVISGLWNPDKGAVFCGGEPYHDVDAAEKAKVFGVLTQDPYLFSATIKENLLMASPTSDEAELWEALAFADLMERVESLPDQLNYYIGEEGQKLSGGERQRLAIARLYLQNPKIVILDEPTSHLDVQTEKIINERLSHWLKDKTNITITHRLEGIEGADFIYLFKNGKILESGTHSQLLKKQSQYYELWKIYQSRFG